MYRTLSAFVAAAVLLVDGVAVAQLTTRQMRTSGTPTTIPAAASNGVSDSVARVDHTHPCATASATQAGCLSSVDWLIFNGKEEPLSFTSGLTRAGNTVSCGDASGSGKGCVTTAAQTFAGAKTFRDGVVTATIDAPDESSLRLRALTGGVIIESGTDKSAAAYPITLLPENNVLSSPSATARVLTLDLATDAVGVSAFRITNSGGAESTYGANLELPKGDLLIGPLASPTATIDVNGEATVYSISANVWGSHGHTDASSGGTLSTSAITSGVLSYARGGTGSGFAPTAGGIVYGTGSAMRASTPGVAGQALLSGGAEAPTWADVGIVTRRTSQGSRFSTAGANTGLSWSMGAFDHRTFVCTLPVYSADSTTSPRFTIVGPTDYVAVWRLESYPTSATAPVVAHYTTGQYSASCTSGCLTSESIWTLTGRISTGATAGTVYVYWASSTLNKYVYLQPGASCMIY